MAAMGIKRGFSRARASLLSFFFFFFYLLHATRELFWLLFMPSQDEMQSLILSHKK